MKGWTINGNRNQNLRKQGKIIRRKKQESWVSHEWCRKLCCAICYNRWSPANFFTPCDVMGVHNPPMFECELCGRKFKKNPCYPSLMTITVKKIQLELRTGNNLSGRKWKYYDPDVRIDDNILPAKTNTNRAEHYFEAIISSSIVEEVTKGCHVCHMWFWGVLAESWIGVLLKHTIFSRYLPRLWP